MNWAACVSVHLDQTDNHSRPALIIFPKGQTRPMKPIGCCFLVLCSLICNTLYGGQRPNIVFILTDDQGYGDLARHGHPLLKTPHTNRLHDESVRFDNFYVSPSCSPTRAALLTGMHEFRNGVTHTRAPREHLWKEATLLPELLRNAGYKTGMIGKWHLGWDGAYHPHQRGFDWTVQGATHFDPTLVIYDEDDNQRRLQTKGFREDRYFDQAMSFIKAAGDQPFFLYLSTYSPHAPLRAPEEYVAPFRGKVTDDEASYLGMIANIDHNVGRLLDFLEDNLLDHNTIVIFMNDNGVTAGLDLYNANMRGSKCTIWEGGSRAMSFWRWPGKWKPKQVDALTAHLDVLPTLCELAGAEIPPAIADQLEGFSMVPLLEAEGTIAWHENRFLFHHVARWPSGMAAQHRYAMAGVRQGDYLLVRSRPCDDPACTTKVLGMQCQTLRRVEKGSAAANYTRQNAQFHWGVTPPNRWVLIDTKADPGCRTDLAASKPERVSAMAAAYDTWWDDVYPVMVARGGESPLHEATGQGRSTPSSTSLQRRPTQAAPRD